MLISNILENYKILHLFRFLSVWDSQKPSSADTWSSQGKCWILATVQQFYIVVSLKQYLKALFSVTKITLVSQNAPS